MYLNLNDTLITMAAQKPVLKHKEVSQKAIDFVNRNKIHPREFWYEALERILGIQENN
jgi:hypothetical protein